jgi:hypothetical protein
LATKLKHPQSFYPNGVPDEAVRHIVRLLFYEGLHIVKRGHGFFDDEMTESESGLEERLREQSNANRANS